MTDKTTDKLFMEYLRRAVNASCTCGGAGPGDGCPACEVWHKMNEIKLAREAAKEKGKRDGR